MRRVLGTILAVVGLGAIAAGILAAVSFGPEGRLAASSSALVSERDSYALVADILAIDAGFPGSSALGEVTIGAEGVGGKPLFIGYATRQAVDKYLDGVGFDAVAQQGSEWQTKSVPGGPPPAEPDSEKLWLGRSSGFDAEVAFKVPSTGEASLVVMNMDASAPVKARITIGYQSSLIFPLSLAAIAVGAVLLLLAVWALWPRKRDRQQAPAAQQRDPVAPGSGAAPPPVPPAAAQPAEAAPAPGGQQGGTSAPADWFRQDSRG